MAGEWAGPAGIHPWIIDHITLRPDHLWHKPPKTEEAFSTPRSWHMLSDTLLQTAPDDPFVRMAGMTRFGAEGNGLRVEELLTETLRAAARKECQAGDLQAPRTCSPP